MNQSSLNLSLGDKQTSELRQKKITRNAKAESSDSQAKKEIALVIGNRIPKTFFWTAGIGESDITIHAGSYHLALKEAGIEKYNIMVYSSILPSIAVESQKPVEDEIKYGSVMETIMAVSNGENGTRLTAGIIYGWLYNRMTGKKYGGLVAEYSGHEAEEEAKETLRKSLNELYENGFSDNYELRNTRLQTRSFVPGKKFGTAIVAIGFKDYVYPIVNG